MAATERTRPSANPKRPWSLVPIHIVPRLSSRSAVMNSSDRRFWALNRVNDAVLEPGQAAAVRADPERAETIFEQRGHVVVAERFGVGSIEDLEVLAVEADEPFLGAEPQIAIARLQDGLDGILRQPLIGLPRVVHVLGQRFVGIESDGRRCPRENQDHGTRANGDDSPNTHEPLLWPTRTVFESTTRAGRALTRAQVGRAKTGHKGRISRGKSGRPSPTHVRFRSLGGRPEDR